MIENGQSQLRQLQVGETVHHPHDDLLRAEAVHQVREASFRHELCFIVVAEPHGQQQEDRCDPRGCCDWTALPLERVSFYRYIGSTCLNSDF